MFSLFGGRGRNTGEDAANPTGSTNEPERPKSVYDMTIQQQLQQQQGKQQKGQQKQQQGDQQQQQEGAGAAQSLVNFDPTGLERAAKAARELDASRHAKEAVEIALQQERTAQMERQARIKEYEIQAKQMEARRAQIEQEEKRKTIEMETTHINHRNKQQDELARRRQQEQIEAQRKLQDEQLKKQEDSLLKQEMIKRQTAEYEKELQRKNEKAKVDAEVEGKIKYERENRTIHIENMKIQAEQLRDTTLQAIKAAGETIGSGVKDFLGDKDRLRNTVISISLLAFGIYAAKTSMGVTGKYIEARLGKPSLIRDTSRISPLQILRHPIQSFKTWRKQDNSKDLMKNIVLSPTLTERMQNIALTTINAKSNRAPFRNILLHGPPGTGKTMFAKSLALNSGMDYAILTGADVAPLGKEAVTEIHKLFDWANSTKKGLVLFVDEAEAFLRKRNSEVISEDLRNALNAFLYRTGENSKKFMLIMASNQPEQLDWAINDRLDDIVHFDLPGKEERKKILKQYFEQAVLNHHLDNKTNTKPITVIGIKTEDLKKAAETTEGFSGRELSKLVTGWQAAAFGNANNTLTHELLSKVLDLHLQQHQQKGHWEKHKKIQN